MFHSNTLFAFWTKQWCHSWAQATSAQYDDGQMQPLTPRNESRCFHLLKVTSMFQNHSELTWSVEYGMLHKIIERCQVKHASNDVVSVYLWSMQTSCTQYQVIRILGNHLGLISKPVCMIEATPKSSPESKYQYPIIIEVIALRYSKKSAFMTISWCTSSPTSLRFLEFLNSFHCEVKPYVYLEVQCKSSNRLRCLHTLRVKSF